MRIDAIIQSSNYADMLAITLPLNKGSFDSVTVWTKRGDEATKAVCAANGVLCKETDRFTHRGSRFNRGAVYNEAFWDLLAAPHLDAAPLARDWFCILDSDIVLPPDWRAQFAALPPDKELFYGARRYNVETADQWAAVQADEAALKGLVLFRGYGYGYLQCFSPYSTTFLRLWHETQGNPYPEWHDGSTADWMFRNAWGHHDWDPPTQPPDHALYHDVVGPCDPPKGLLRQLPFHTVHLGVTGVNCTGRHTPLWTASSVSPTST